MGQRRFEVARQFSNPGRAHQHLVAQRISFDFEAPRCGVSQDDSH